MKTVAVRFPKNKTLIKILKSLNFPLAIPSANKSTHISPVSAEDVSQEFQNSIKFILNGGPCQIGIESTVVDLTSKPKILRPGFKKKSDEFNNVLMSFPKINFLNIKKDLITNNGYNNDSIHLNKSGHSIVFKLLKEKILLNDK